MSVAAAEEQPRATVYGWYVVVILACAHLLSFVDRYVMSLVMEPLKADLRLSDTQLGMLQGTSFVVLYTIVTLPLGLMADHIHRRNLIIGGILAWSIATALCGLAQSFGALFLARVAVGLGEAALVPAAMSLIAAYVPRHQLGRAVSVFTTGSSLGKSTALIAGGAVLAALTQRGGLTLAGIGHTAPWQGTFIAAAMPGIALALLLLTLREPARIANTTERRGFSTTLRWIAGRRKAYMAHALAATTIVLIIQAFGGWAVTYYVRSFGLTAAEAGVRVGAVVLLAAPAGHLCGGALLDMLVKRGARAPASMVMTASLIASVAVLFGFLIVKSLGLSLLLLALTNFTMTIGSPAGLCGIQMLTPEPMRGATTALFMAFVTFVGIGMGPALVGYAADTLGGPAHIGGALALVLSSFACIGVVAALAGQKAFALAATDTSQ